MQLIAKPARRTRTPPPRRVGLDIVVQQLHRVQLRAVAGQNVQLDLVGVASQPGTDQPGPVYRMASHDQVDLPPAAIPEQPTQKVDEHPTAERPDNRRNRNLPALEMTLSMVTRNRLPVPLMTGV